jgi:hypothetical protein
MPCTQKFVRKSGIVNERFLSFNLPMKIDFLPRTGSIRGFDSRPRLNLLIYENLASASENWWRELPFPSDN